MITLTESEIDTITASKMDKDWLARRIEEPVQGIHLNYYFKRANGKWPNQIFVYFMSAGVRGWLSRKSSMIELCSRPATRQECVEEHFRLRFKYHIYNDWSKLIEDEKTEGCSEEFTKQLEELAKKYPV